MKRLPALLALAILYAAPHARAQGGYYTQPSSVRTEHLRIPASTAAGLLELHKDPVYPRQVLEQHIVGTVTLHATVDAYGNVTEVDPRGGPDLLKKPAMEAVHRWKYRPYIVNGQPVGFETTVLVKFAPKR